MRNPTSSASAARVSQATASKTTPCCIKIGLKRGPWTPEEDELLSNYIRREGEGRWRTLPKRAGLHRCGKSCRLRWMNYLRPCVKRGHIAPDEEDLILRLHRLLGNRWSLIAGRIPGRTDNEIKNYWNTHLSKKLISQGIDPRTHKPLNPSPSISSADIHAAAPASKPNPNPNPNYSGLEQMVGGGNHGGIAIDKGKGHFKGTNLDQNSPGIGNDDDDRDENWQNSDGLMMLGLQSSHGNSCNEDADIDYCTDDIFSLFLNSLINEEVFVNQQQQQQQPDAIAPPDPLVSSSEALGYGAVWEAALTSSSAAGNPEGHSRFVDRVNKHF